VTLCWLKVNSLGKRKRAPPVENSRHGGRMAAECGTKDKRIKKKEQPMHPPTNVIREDREVLQNMHSAGRIKIVNIAIKGKKT